MPNQLSFYVDGEWITPTDSAMPVGIGGSTIPYPPMVKRHEYTDKAGSGKPAGRYGELWAEVGRPIIEQEGYDWYYSTLGLAGRDYLDAGICLYDPLTASWNNYSCRIWRPVYRGASAGSRLLDFTILITNIELANPAYSSDSISISESVSVVPSGATVFPSTSDAISVSENVSAS